VRPVLGRQTLVPVAEADGTERFRNRDDVKHSDRPLGSALIDLNPNAQLPVRAARPLPRLGSDSGERTSQRIRMARSTAGFTVVTRLRSRACLPDT
jgi:hypothetical protein